MFRIRIIIFSEYEKSIFTKQNYMLGPFLRGQTITILTTVRRTMLKEIEGLASIGIIIPKVRCEYETAPGVQEDVLTILLELKQVIFKGKINSDKPFNVIDLNVGKILKEEAPSLVIAGYLEVPLNLKILNPEALIATTIGFNNLKTRNCFFSQLISNKHIWKILVGLGKGYVKSKDLINQNPLNFLPLNNSFSPVEGYKYKFNIAGTMKNTFVTVQTTGSISPEATFSVAAIHLMNTFY